MKKLICMIALGAVSFGSVFAAAPTLQMQTDTSKKMMKKEMKMKKDSMKMQKKMMKDTTKMKKDTTKKM